MNSKQAVLLSLLLIATLAFSVGAFGQEFQSFFVESKTVKNDIAQNDFAEFGVTISNTQDFEDTFRVLPFEDPKWAHQLIPLDDFTYGKKIPAGGRATLRLLVKPSGLELGRYNVKLTVKSETTQKTVDAILRLRITKPALALRPDFSARLLVPAQVDPRQKNTVKVLLHNNNALDLENISIVLSSNLVNKQTVVSLAGIEEKAVEFTVALDPYLAPQKDTLRVVVVHNEKTVMDTAQDYRVVEFVPVFKQEVSSSKQLWKVVRTIKLTNEGNVRKEETARLETTTRESLFTTSVPAAAIVSEKGKRYYTWKVVLDPKQSTSISVTTNYRFLAGLMFVIIVGLIYFYATRKYLVVRKSVKSVKKAHGAITEAKIVLHIRNRTNNPVRDVRVVERVPKIFSVRKDGFEASPHPSKIHLSEKEGTIMDFHLHDLEPHDERIINYTVTPKLHIFGDMPVKPTIVEYKSKKGKKQTAKSNTLHIPSENQPQNVEKKLE
ncbi:hypothetical protein HZB03_03305 [Candidatus Woesearchaeota archaeon]|nr:hypothetical protein [Candidatus Woesearchaeota archaeon]